MPRVPYALPFVGHLMQLGERAYETMHKWASVYGPVYSLYLGQQKVIVLNGPAVIREALLTHGEEFAGRPKLYMIHATLKGKGLISSGYTSDFFEHKKFLMQKINRFGRRRSSLETNCMQTIKETLDQLRERIDHNFEVTESRMKHSLSQIASQNVLTMTFGTRMYDKENFSTLMDLITENFSNTAVAAAFNFVPVTRIFKTYILKVDYSKLNNMLIRLCLINQISTQKINHV
jgi:cytochrome P450 family 2 subfamily C